MVGLLWKIPLKWIIWGSTSLWKPPCCDVKVRFLEAAAVGCSTPCLHDEPEMNKQLESLVQMLSLDVESEALNIQLGCVPFRIGLQVSTCFHMVLTKISIYLEMTSKCSGSGCTPE